MVGGGSATPPPLLLLAVNWSVFVDRNGLPLSASTFWRIDPTERFFDTSTTTDYLTWSSQPRVTAPPSGKVAVTSGPPVLPETDDDIDVLAARPATGSPGSAL
ncbi:hypothetical protein AB0B45_24015 [Nonomuraea sp. NPDC049152]|uniref:hypothetical protein n=1 Tax=Nonomuraea sp. NPDC049152 TaxID=3154350 RepID=UPI00340EDDFD